MNWLQHAVLTKIYQYFKLLNVLQIPMTLTDNILYYVAAS